MNVDTGALQALTHQLAELTEQVRERAQTRMSLEACFAAGLAAGEDKAQGELLGRAAKTARPSRPHRSHLRSVDGGVP